MVSFRFSASVGVFFWKPLRIVALHEAWPFKQKAYDDAAAAGDPTDRFWQVLLVGYKKDTK